MSFSISSWSGTSSFLSMRLNSCRKNTKTKQRFTKPVWNHFFPCHFFFKLQRWYISHTAKRRSFHVVWWSIESFQPYMVTCEKRSRCTAIGMWSRLKKKKSNSTCCEGRKIKTDVKLSLTVVTFRKQQQQRVRMLSFWKSDTFFFFSFFFYTRLTENIPQWKRVGGCTQKLAVCAVWRPGATLQLPDFPHI